MIKIKGVPDAVIAQIYEDLVHSTMGNKQIAMKNKVDVYIVKAVADKENTKSKRKQFQKIIKNKSNTASVNNDILEVEIAEEVPKIIEKSSEVTKCENQNIVTDLLRVPIDPKISLISTNKSINTNKLSMIYSKDNIKNAGLVKDRHSMPCTDYIFNGPIPENLLFNYHAQETIMRKFIQDNFKRIDGGWDKSLYLYTTGMTCCLATAIKVCQQMMVNLTVMHYNCRSKIYKAQVIWDQFKCVAKMPIMFKDDYGKYKDIYTYNCRIEELYKLPEFYSITTKVADANPYTESITLAATEDDLYDVAKSMITKLRCGFKTSMIASRATINSGVYTANRLLFRMSNCESNF